MPLTTQGKILRVLTDQSFTRVGGRTMIRVEVRIISGSARDLITEIAESRFREDLYYRLNVVPVHIPPLRERRDDIASLCDHYIRRYAADRRVAPPEISSEAMAALQAHEWPGNVRELRNVIERVMILAPSEPPITPMVMMVGSNSKNSFAPSVAAYATVLRTGCPVNAIFF